jgi:hypothetical protein
MTDYLDRETSVLVEVTETGLQAKTRSRFVAAVDRLGGNLLELVNAPIERRIVRQRAVAAGEGELVAAVTKFGLEKLRTDPAFAERVAERYFARVFEKQQNKDAVLREALEDLRHDPHPESTAAERPLENEFLDRLEHYAEGATSEALHQKWGRVLSAEIKTPGTFSAKVMRIVDELDSETAQLFEQVCKSAIKGVVPKCVIGILKFPERTILVSAGLLLDPGITGHVSVFNKVKTNEGKELWTYSVGDRRSVAFPADTPLQSFALPDFAGPVQMNNDLAAIPSYLLSDVGTAISTIFPANDAALLYVKQLRKALPGVTVTEYEADETGMYRALPDTSDAAS